MERVRLQTQDTDTGAQTGPDRGSVRSARGNSRRIGAATIKAKKREQPKEFEEQKRRGRPKGAKNKTGLLVKEAILLAAEQTGENGRGREGTVGFLKRLARREPKAFAQLLGRLIPVQVENDPEPPEQVHRHYHSVSDIRAALKQRGLVVDELYEKPMKVIEHRKDELKQPPREMSSVQKAMIGRG
jgi:hypothetical protein